MLAGPQFGVIQTSTSGCLQVTTSQSVLPGPTWQLAPDSGKVRLALLDVLAYYPHNCLHRLPNITQVQWPALLALCSAEHVLGNQFHSSSPCFFVECDSTAYNFTCRAPAKACEYPRGAVAHDIRCALYSERVSHLACAFLHRGHSRATHVAFAECCCPALPDCPLTLYGLLLVLAVIQPSAMLAFRSSVFELHLNLPRTFDDARDTCRCVPRRHPPAAATRVTRSESGKCAVR